MTPDTTAALKLAEAALADDWSPNIRTVAHGLARAVLALAAEVERMRAVVEAAQMWRHGLVVLPDGRLVDTDDGSAEPGMRRLPARVVLVAKIDALRAAKEQGE